MLLRKRSPFVSSLPLRLLGVATLTGLAAQACANGTPSGSSTSSQLGGGGGGGAACGIGTLALANVGAGACSKNSLGGSAFDSSCTGNSGEPEYWCADFARWAWAASGADVGGLTAAAGSFYTYGETHKTMTDTPSVGDAVVFNYTGGGVASHVAIVTQVNTDGSIETASGDWGGESGSEAHFASTSHVVLNSPAYPGTVGSTPSIIGMKISAFVSPSGISGCAGGADGGAADGSSGGGGSSGAGGAGGSAGSGGGGADGSGGGDSDSGGGGGAAGSGGGGSSGSGGGGSSGSGGGGSGGAGGSSGKGGGGSGGSSGMGGGYSFVERKGLDRHHAIDLEATASETVPFAWHDASGLAPPADLWVEVDGRPLLQVSAVGDRPFVRAGLEVAPLVPNAAYRIVFVRDSGSVNVTLLGASGEVVLRTRTPAGTLVADVVLPPTSWRASIASSSLE